MTEFNRECDEWLNPLGYTVYSSSNNDKTLTYTSSDLDIHKPSIKCYLNNTDHEEDIKSCSLFGGNSMKMYISMQVTNLQFKHPYIIDWINKMSMYDKQIKVINNYE